MKSKRTSDGRKLDHATIGVRNIPAIRAEARAVGATIYFIDVSGIRSDYYTGAAWALQGCTPVVKMAGKRFSLDMIPAVSAQGEFRFLVREGGVTTIVHREFLGRLMRLVRSKHEMKRLAIGALRRIQKLPALVKSFFRQSGCQYASM